MKTRTHDVMAMTPAIRSRQFRHHSGVVLPMLLIFLLMMMVLGFAALRSAALEEQMAANTNNRLLAFQSAERALRHCESQLQLIPIPDALPQLGQGPLLIDGKNTKNHWEIPENWRSDQASLQVPDVAGTNSLPPPRCIIERLSLQSSMQFHLQAPPSRPAFRITARGVGPVGTAVVMLQSYLLL